jgi:hypothetical protein
MKNRSTIIAFLISLALFGVACSKGGDAGAGGASVSNAAASMSDDEKHKLFEAASAAKNFEIKMEVQKNLGLTDSEGKKPTAAFQPFLQAHDAWLVKNASFKTEYADQNKAKDYVASHMPK